MVNPENNKFDQIFHKAVNFMMLNGKKAVAYKILKRSIIKARENLKLKGDATLFINAVYNASPDIEIKTKKIGTNLYQIPRPITNSKKINLGIKNILQASDMRKEYTMTERLTGELIEAYNNKGLAVKKKEEIHKLAESNKSFSHFNW
jgi:small subunit ribosomal protein S7